MIRLFFILLLSLVAYAQETTTTVDTTTTTTEETTTTTSLGEPTSTTTTSTTLWPRIITYQWDVPTTSGIGGINIYEVIDGSHILKGSVWMGMDRFTIVDIPPGKHCYIVANVEGETLMYSNQACFYQDRGRARLKFRPRVIP